MTTTCVFCEIIHGDQPGALLYDDGRIVAIMDKRPLTTGHVLVMPKQHYENIFDINQTLAESLMAVTWKISNAIRKVLEPAGLNILQNNGTVANQNIPHLHIHLIPRYHNDGLLLGRWSAHPAEPEQLAEVAAEIRSIL